MLAGKMCLMFSTLILSGSLALAQQALPALPPPAAAPAQALPANAPTREQLMKLFDALQLRRTMEASQDAAIQNVKTMLQGMFRQNAPTPNADQQRMLDELMSSVMDDVRSVFSIDEMIEAVIPVYQRHLTTDDVDALLAFQNSPTGRKMVSLQPVMLQETYQAMAPLQQRAMPEIMRRVNERLQKLMQAAPGNRQQD